MLYILAVTPMMQPYIDLLWWQFAILSLPYLSLTLAAVIALIAGKRLSSKMDGRTIHFYYLSLATLLVSFNLVILL
jgi:hypothetical protein